MGDDTRNVFPPDSNDDASSSQDASSSDQDSTASSASDSSSSDSGGAVAASSSSGGVNPQILDAVSQTTSAVMGTAANQGAATAYQKVAQATAFAVQDATDYSRNISNIAMTAQGVIVTKMLEDQSNIPIYTPVLATLQEMVTAAATNLATVGTTAGDIATSYPATKT
ncbi:hypothetical protein V5T82_17640 [Magnetovibrio sp. PR-2]|uniref:hypothetical protein n=1 Tax=Magnetovibrio sp. PR-2 TaxID=3120356 RepID=UPI002FCE54D5